MIPLPVEEPEVLRPGESPRTQAPPERQARSPLLLRAIAAVLLAAAGLLAFGVGVPVLLLGCALLLIAFFTLAGGGRWHVRRF
ncbi:MAG: hypothetical protein HY554_03825 [Elusimicrobia bacterium]|nr:hypothetical protein [Elusimicrobiota bacterium]